MKRHLYKLPQYTEILTPRRELRVAALKYIREQEILTSPAMKFFARRKLRRRHVHVSKTRTYCLVTGRVRYTIKDTQTSRHIFFEYCSAGFLPGYFFAS